VRQVDVHDPVGNPICHPVASLQSSLGLQQDPNSTYMQAVNGAPLAACLQHLSLGALWWVVAHGLCRGAESHYEGRRRRSWPA